MSAVVFTGELGTADSQPGFFELGAVALEIEEVTPPVEEHLPTGGRAPLYESDGDESSIYGRNARRESTLGRGHGHGFEGRVRVQSVPALAPARRSGRRDVMVATALGGGVGYGTPSRTVISGDLPPADAQAELYALALLGVF